MDGGEEVDVGGVTAQGDNVDHLGGLAGAWGGVVRGGGLRCGGVEVM